MNRTTMLAALAIAVLGAVLFMIRKERYTDQVTGGYLVPVVTLRQNVREGRPLAPLQLTVVGRPPAYVEERHVRGEDLDDVLGIPIRQDLRAGATLRWSDLEANAQERGTPSALLAPGQRAVTIHTGTKSFHRMMRRGDRVDVLFTGRREGDDVAVTVVLAQNVLVLADEITLVVRNGETRSSRQVTLAVSPEQGALLEHAERDGANHTSLGFVARHPADDHIVRDTPTATNADLIEPEERRRRQRSRPRATPMIEQIL
jgi:Flp pilus assembly protein CpaB